jgi:hypothetical protein
MLQWREKAGGASVPTVPVIPEWLNGSRGTRGRLEVPG